MDAGRHCQRMPLGSWILDTKFNVLNLLNVYYTVYWHIAISVGTLAKPSNLVNHDSANYFMIGIFDGVAFLGLWQISDKTRQRRLIETCLSLLQQTLKRQRTTCKDFQQYCIWQCLAVSGKCLFSHNPCF